MLRGSIRKALLVGISLLVCAAGVPSVQAATAGTARTAQSSVAPDPTRLGHARGIVPRHSPGSKTPAAGTASANPNCSSCAPPLRFTQGAPVIGGTSGSPGHVTITPVYWAPAGYSFSSAYKSILDGYLQNVAVASGQGSNVYSTDTQYYQQAAASGSPLVHIQYAITAGAEVDDTNAYPSSGCAVASGFRACILDSQLQAELRGQLAASGLAIDDSHLYMVMFPSGVETCLNSSQCSSNTYCAYHSSTSASPYLLYSNQPYPDLAHCSDPFNGAQAPNGDAEADAQVSLISHEANETITDWDGAWLDANQYENGDQCAYVYGTPLGSTGGSNTLYNQVVGSGKYYTQDEFSNEDYALGKGDLTAPGGKLVAGCVQREEPLVASYAAPASVTAGTSAGFDGSSSTDPDNSASALSYTWSWGDGTASSTGVKPAHTFGAAGNYSVGLTVAAPDGSTATTSQTVSVAASTPTAPASAAGSMDHVFVIVMENHSYNEIIGSTSAPYINSLLATGGLATNYYAVAHPSLPNYLALTGASTYGVTSDCTTCWINATNIGDNIESAGKTWKAYEESMPSACFVGDSYPYAQKHDPFIYYNDVRTNASRCQSHVVPYSSLASDLGAASTTPNYAFITPNMCNDMHDCSVSTGDSWLSQQVPAILRSPAFTTQRSLLAIVWDEDDFSGTNQVPALLIGTGVIAGMQSPGGYNHYSLLSTIESTLGVTTLTSNDAGAAQMNDFFLSTNWTSLGGVISSGPSATSWGPGRTDIFALGQDNGLWHRYRNGAAWSGWESLGGYLTSDPAAVSWGPNRIDIFARGQDRGIWHMAWTGSYWTGWSSLGGVVLSAPEVSSWGWGRLDVFVQGQDNGVWHMAGDGNNWGAWQSLGGAISSNPSAVSWGPNRIDIFARGQDNALWHLDWNGSGWSAWQSLGGTLTSGPAASSCAWGHLDVFALGGSGATLQLGFTGLAWTSWLNLGGTGTSNPAAECGAAAHVADVFDRGSDNALWHRQVIGS